MGRLILLLANYQLPAARCATWSSMGHRLFRIDGDIAGIASSSSRFPCVCGSGIARARESRRTNFARSLCGRFREGISRTTATQHFFLEHSAWPDCFVSPRMRMEDGFGCRFPVALPCLPCIELLRLYAVEDGREIRLIRVRHTRWFASRAPRSNDLGHQTTTKAGPCDRQIVSRFVVDIPIHDCHRSPSTALL